MGGYPQTGGMGSMGGYPQTAGMGGMDPYGQMGGAQMGGYPQMGMQASPYQTAYNPMMAGQSFAQPGMAYGAPPGAYGYPGTMAHGAHGSRRRRSACCPGS